MSEPAVDIANFVAHLMLLGGQQGDGIGHLQPVVDAFLRRSHELDPELNAELVTFLTATNLLRLAGIHVTRSRGLEVAGALVERVEAILAQVTLPPR